MKDYRTLKSKSSLFLSIALCVSSIQCFSDNFLNSHSQTSSDPNQLNTNNNQTEHANFSKETVFDLEVNDNTEFSLGRKKIEYNSLIYDQTYNQGFAGTFSMPKFNSKLKTFSSNTNANNANAINKVGIEDHHNRANGVIWDYSPQAILNHQFHFTTSYLSGKDSINKTEGDAVSISSRTSVFNNSVQLRGEYAESTFRDLTIANDSDDTNQAQHFSIQYSPVRSGETRRTKSKWNIGVEKKIIDAHFQTVFNRHLPKDKDITRFFGRHQKLNWSSEVSVSYEKNNLHKNLSHSENISHNRLTGRYKQDSKKATKKYFSFLGKQEYALHYNRFNKDQTFTWLDSDDVFLSNFNENNVEKVTFEAKHFYDDWHWFYRAARTKADDRLHINGKFYKNELELGSTFQFAENTTIETRIRSLFSRKTRMNLVSSELHYRFKINRNLPIESTKSRLEVNYHERDTDITNDINELQTIVSLSGDISRQLYKPKGIYPGVDLSLSADYKKEKNDFAGIEYKNYKTLMNLSISW